METQHNILIVDDEQDVLNSLGRVFRNPKYKVYAFDDATSALSALPEIKPDLIVSDMRMPKMDGAEFLCHAKDLRPMTPRILLTGHADKDDTVRAINDGEIFAYVSKPWNNEQFLNLADEAIARRDKDLKKNRALHTLKKMHEDVSERNADIEQKLEEESKQRTETTQALNDAYALIGESFLNLLDMKQPGQRALAYQLEEVVQKLAGRLGLGESDIRLLTQAARLHGIGKIGVPDEILDKPFAKMSEDEQVLYKSYPANSACTIIAIETFSDCSDLLFKQKEASDGTGYPMGLKRDDLSKLNLIFNAALEYCEKRYSPVVIPVSHDNAMQRLKARPGAFDADVLKALSSLEIERNLVKNANHSIVVPLHSLEPGMIVKEDIFGERNMLLLRGGSIVTESLIDKLANMQKRMGEPITVSVHIPSQS